MRYSIAHTTKYVYEESVRLYPHLIRLRPRTDGCQALNLFQCLVTPAPIQQSNVIDLDGNSLIKVWFDGELTQQLIIQTNLQIETFRTNPFDYLLEPWVTQLPLNYPTALLTQLKPYLQGQCPGFSEAIDPIAIQLAQEIWLAVNGNPISFLSELNSRIYKECKYIIRETGVPLLPGLTWTQKAGSCRDVAVLFMEVCRAVGLAARFVSGYQEGDPDSHDRQLHAWAEVYLPGAGWRGFDPTHGLAVSDRHIALVASAAYPDAAPIVGSVYPPGVPATMTYSLMLQSMD